MRSVPSALGVKTDKIKNKDQELILVFTLVRETGLEPVRRNTHAPQTCASADSATPANVLYYTIFLSVCQGVLKKFFKVFYYNDFSGSPRRKITENQPCQITLRCAFCAPWLTYQAFYGIIMLKNNQAEGGAK